MEEEEDDFYAPNGDQPVKDEESFTTRDETAIKDEDMDGQDAPEDENGHGDNDDDGDLDDDDDDDSDIDIITEIKDGAVEPPPTQARSFKGIKPELPRTASADPASSQRSQPPPSKSETSAQTKKVTVSLKDGSKYPEVRTSSIDVNSVPTWSQAGKAITDLDIDADLAEHTKPWRLPGTDQTDYFNYGFDEFTWTQYCLRQQSMRSAIDAQKQETKQFEMMLTGQPGPGSAPGPMGMGMPGMPDMSPEMMTSMFAYMQAQGISDPSQIDFPSFMQHMQQMGMPGMPGMPGQPPSGPGGQGNFGGQQMQQQASAQAYANQQHGQSPFPNQQNQGFGGGTPQPQQQGGQAYGQQSLGPQQGFEGYSPQQIAMMQSGGAPHGPGGGGRGRGRGRRW